MNMYTQYRMTKNKYIELINGQTGGKYHKYHRMHRSRQSNTRGELVSSRTNRNKKLLESIGKHFGGSGKKYILLDGTSSAGKSSIAKLLKNRTNDYMIISYDDYADNINTLYKAKINVEKQLDPNQYMNQREKGDMINREIRKMMYHDANESKKNIIYDEWNQDILNLYQDKKDVFVIVIYASLETLIKNILKRRFTEPRNRYVLKMYADRYVIDDTTSDPIDSINRNELIQALKNNLKYEFESEDTLIAYAKMIFATMGIDDDKQHNIRLRDEFRYDYMVKTGNKNLEQVVDELSQFTTDSESTGD